MSLRELEKYTKQFIQKAVQVIVQSRLGGERIKTECNRNGTDWFSLAVPDIADVTEQAKKAIETLNGDELSSNDGSGDIKRSFSLSSKWRLCCEISLKTTEGETMILEYWFITNEAIEKSEVATSPTTRPTPSTEIFDIYNKMSIMLRSLITMARATPAYKISSTGQGADSYVILYRVYQSDYSFENVLSAKEAEHYTSETKLGTISSKLNRLSVSIVWRTDMVSCAAQSCDRTTNAELMPVKNDHFNKDQEQQSPVTINPMADASLKPLLAAFASSSPSSKIIGDALPQLPENAFSTLLIANDELDFNNGTSSTTSNGISVSKNMESNGSGSSLMVTHSESKPIKIPEPKIRKKFPDLSVSPGCSSGDSDFVIVDLKAPFASQDQQELGSFFTGPAPSFTCSGDLTEELCDFPSHIATFESTMEQLGSFVDSVCTPDMEESKIEVI